MILSAIAYPIPAIIIGFIWLFGRIIFFIGYIIEPKKRAAGFIISLLC